MKRKNRKNNKKAKNENKKGLGLLEQLGKAYPIDRTK